MHLNQHILMLKIHLVVVVHFYQITVVSDQFQGKLTLARHRAVQTVLKDIIPQIHGLNLYTHTPQQWEELTKSKDTGV
eukprot:UN03057